MRLSPGYRLGPYEVLSVLGAGGMGEVYRARDIRLDRTVAVKVLPAAMAADTERRERFEREARAVSALNHPHICALYDVGRQDDLEYLVMELVDGETLADRLTRGPLPLDQALKLGSEIASALTRAHRQGIVHRDLKPGNVMLTRQGAKLLDFGLARMEVPGSATAGTVLVTHLPTQPRPITQAGAVLGTFQYMSPEQLEGREADARTDIFSFGALLYEAITGRRAFEGASQASLISAIMTGSPTPISSLQPTTPPALDRVIRTCLAKDPDERWQTAQDLGAELKWIAEGGSQTSGPVPSVPPRRSRERWAWAVAGLLGLVAATAVAQLIIVETPRREVTRFAVPPPRDVTLTWPRLSPDGRTLAFVGIDGQNRRSIWVRPLSSFTAERLEGTDGVFRPFWSPGSDYLAFFANGQLKKVAIAGGSPQLLGEMQAGADGSWSSAGVILFDGFRDPIRRVPDTGGVPTVVVPVKAGEASLSPAWPVFLPDGRHFLFVYSDDTGPRSLQVGSIDTGEITDLGPIRSRVEYGAGHIYYLEQQTLMARPFLSDSRRFTGEPFPVASDRLQMTTNGGSDLSVSNEGDLAYVAAGQELRSRLLWVDRSGREIESVGEPALYSDLDLAPDDRVAAVTIDSPNERHVWVLNLRQRTSSRLTFGTDLRWRPTISPDGARVAYAVGRGRERPRRIVARSADGAGEERELASDPAAGLIVPMHWSPDGLQLLLVAIDQPLTNGDLRVMQVSTPGPGRPFVQTPAPVRELNARFSPNSRWIAYESNESGRFQIYVQAAAGGARWQVSIAGGRSPLWRGDTRELFFDVDDTIYAAAVRESATGLDFDAPVRLFERRFTPLDRDRRRWAVSRDGQRFLVNTPVEGAQPAAVQVVLNSAARLTRK